jgi:Spy/CpxP family protein refolding chaperone
LLPYSLAALALVATAGVAVHARTPVKAAPAQAGTSAAPQNATEPRHDGQRGGGPPRGGDRPWWLDEATRKELNLTPQQSKDLDKIWNDARPKLTTSWDEFTKRQAELTQLVDQKADEQVIGLKFDQVEAWRTQAYKTRFLMLYRMRRVLTDEQNKTLDKMRRGRPPHDHPQDPH